MTGRPLAWGFVALSAATYALLVLGALVRANGAGLACPDWPLCFGQVIPGFNVRVGFEWGHRALAGSISIGLAVLTVGLVRSGLARELRVVLVVAWALLGVQVGLGGLTVLLLLAPWTVTAHLLVGTAFCGALVWITASLFERDAPRERVALGRGLRAAVAATAVLLVGQLALGGMVSSHAAGLACAGFPTCDGTSIAPTFAGLQGLHVLHRLNAYALAACVLLLVVLVRGTGPVAALSRTAARLVVLQIAVGVANVAFRLPVEITGLHSALAAALALVTLLLVRETALARVPAPAAVQLQEAAS